MTDLSQCFVVQAPCFSEDGINCIAFDHASAISSATVTIDYVCSEPIDFDVEFEIRADGHFTTDADFPTVIATADLVGSDAPATFTMSANIAGALRGGIHVDLIARVRIDGEALEGVENIHANIEISD